MKSVTITFLAILFLQSNTSIAQSIYQLKYQQQQGSSNTDYDAFLVCNETGTGFVRLSFTSAINQQNTLVEMRSTLQFVTDENGQTDTTQFFYKTANPVIIKGNKLTNVPPAEFWFKVTPSTKLAEPAFVKIADAGNSGQPSPLLTASLLTSQTLSKELLLQFFDEGEAFYANLFNPSVRALTALEKMTKIHLLIVANTNDATIGIPCNNSMALMEETFTNLAAYLGLKIQVTKIFGNTYTKTNVEQQISALKPGFNDVLIFYYVGHGFRKAKDNRSFPFLDLRANPKEDFMTQSLNLEDIYTTIKLKNARLNIVMGDCCNSDPYATNPMAAADPRPRASELDFDLEKCRSLFLNTKRMSLLMTAAEKGQLASCNAELGAFFSFYFKGSMENALRDVKTKNVSWYQVLDKAKLQTVDKARRTYCSKPYVPANICKQTPQYQVL